MKAEEGSAGAQSLLSLGGRAGDAAHATTPQEAAVLSSLGLFCGVFSCCFGL